MFNFLELKAVLTELTNNLAVSKHTKRSRVPLNPFLYAEEEGCKEVGTEPNWVIDDDGVG